jgi:hypothetical protein
MKLTTRQNAWSFSITLLNICNKWGLDISVAFPLAAFWNSPLNSKKPRNTEFLENHLRMTSVPTAQRASVNERLRLLLLLYYYYYYYIKISNRCFEIVAQFRYLGKNITNKRLIQEEIKRKLTSGNACYHSVQNILFSRLLSKNIKIRITKL